MKYENTHTARLFRATRERQKRSVRVMARLLKVSSSTLNRIEDGHTAPKAAVMERLLALEGTSDVKNLFLLAYLIKNLESPICQKNGSGFCRSDFRDWNQASRKLNPVEGPA